MTKPSNNHPCRECGGSGVCRMCGGTGKLNKETHNCYGTCPLCYGTGLCITCQAPASKVRAK